MDELALVKASQRGEKAAFGSLIDSYYKKIYRLAYYYIGYHEEADDICQETFLQAFNSIRELRNRNCFKGWIFMIASNLLRKRVKEIKRKKVTENLGDGRNELADDKNIGPLETLSSKERAMIIHRQLQKMPENIRFVTILILMEGLTQKDAAAILDCSETSVSRHLRVARKWLRAKLRDLV